MECAVVCLNSMVRMTATVIAFPSWKASGGQGRKGGGDGHKAEWAECIAHVLPWKSGKRFPCVRVIDVVIWSFSSRGRKSALTSQWSESSPLIMTSRQAAVLSGGAGCDVVSQRLHVEGLPIVTSSEAEHYSGGIVHSRARLQKTGTQHCDVTGSFTTSQDPAAAYWWSWSDQVPRCTSTEDRGVRETSQRL